MGSQILLRALVLSTILMSIMPIAVSRVHIDSTNLSLGVPIPELSWTKTASFPAVNGYVIYPTLAQPVPPPAYDTHWYAGGAYPRRTHPRTHTQFT